MTNREQGISDVVTEVSELIAFARSRWARAAEEVHPELRGITLMLLHLITKHGPVSAKTLGCKLDMDKALVSRHVSHLRDLGFVEAEESAEDRRVQLLTVSDEGRQLLKQFRERSQESYVERFDNWSLEEIELLRRGLHRFNTGD